MGWAIFHQGIWGVTAKISVTFRQPVTIGEDLRVVGEIARDRGRLIETRGTVLRAEDGTVLAEAEATFLRMPEGRRRELEQRYGGNRGRVRACAGRGRARRTHRSARTNLVRDERTHRESEQVTE